MIPLSAIVLSAAVILPAPEDTAEGPPRGFDLHVRVFASADEVGHPISLAIDERGRVFVAETRRYTFGVKQSRGDQELEDEELRARTVDDFKRVLREYVEKGRYRRSPETDRTDPEYVFYTELSDEVAVYEDRDGDGVSDLREVFADGFNDWYSGPGADVFVEDGQVYYTCIPDLWRMWDDDGDGRASESERERMYTGLGVVFSFLAHDMHGLVRGNDGRLYWSIGDRSFHVETRDGAVLEGKMGAVFRCDPDGANLEVFCRGLRNPQDLAFNAYGDLVTGDNNCDKGDLARILHLVEGGDHGWRLPVQRARSGGPWMRERMWWTRAQLADDLGLPTPSAVHKSAMVPAWLMPPLYHPRGQGPSGMFAYPGLGLPERYDDHLFLTHCAGGGGFIQAFQVVPDGAGSRVKDFHTFVEEGPITGPSDAIFGYDGRIYSTNWGSGWNPNDDACIYTVSHDASLNDPRIAEVARLFAEGFFGRSVAELSGMLGHVDMRVRQRAQFALARGDDAAGAELVRVATDAAAPRFARMHAIWGIGQRWREGGRERADLVTEALLPLVDPQVVSDPFVRERAMAELAEMGFVPDDACAGVAGAKWLRDPSPRVAFQAAMAIAKAKRTAALPCVIQAIDDNDDRDAFLRHALVLALASTATQDDLAALSARTRALRLSAVLALRRQGSSAVATFLSDPNFQVRSEAARAVYDLRLEDKVPELASTLDAPVPEFEEVQSEGLIRRALWANLRVGTADAAARVLRFAAGPFAVDEHRLLALDLIDTWDQPPEKEGVWYDFWSSPARAEAIGRDAYRAAQRSGLLEQLRSRSEGVRVRAAELDDRLLPPRPTEELLQVARDGAENAHLRMAALRRILARSPEDRASAIEAALAVGTSSMRIAARDALLIDDPSRALVEALAVLDTDAVEEAGSDPSADAAQMQHALRVLASLPAPRARFVRCSLPGVERILSLAEVRVFGDGGNLAEAGRATQSSVGWEGVAGLAIDGDTIGDHSREPAVTHSAIETDPWWEVDLGGAHEIQRIELWNRTDGSLFGRLDGVVITLLSEDRAEVWRHTLSEAPEVSVSIGVGVGGDVGAIAAARLMELGKELAAGTLDPALELEAANALRGLGSAPASSLLRAYERNVVELDPLGAFRAAVSGGDPIRGEELFRFHRTAQCLRCHNLNGMDSTVGPDLSGIALRSDARGIVQSMVDPDAAIAKGYGTVHLTLHGGEEVYGVDLESGADPICVLVGSEVRRIRARDVRARSASSSAMVSMRDVLSIVEVRDVAAFLATMRAERAAAPRRIATAPESASLPNSSGATLEPTDGGGTSVGDDRLSAMELAGGMALAVLLVIAAGALLLRPR